MFSGWLLRCIADQNGHFIKDMDGLVVVETSYY